MVLLASVMTDRSRACVCLSERASESASERACVYEYVCERDNGKREKGVRKHAALYQRGGSVGKGETRAANPPPPPPPPPPTTTTTATATTTSASASTSRLLTHVTA